MATNQLIFGALSRALKTSYFHRDGGAEEQAGKKLEDYRPDGKELLTYWENVIDYLISIKGKDKGKAEEIIIEKFKSQYVEGNSTAIISAIKQIIEGSGEIHNELRQQFTDLVTDRFRISKEQKIAIQELLDGSRPKDIKKLLGLTVIAAPYQSERTTKGHVDIASEKARQFAHELIESKNWSWLEELENLQKGEQRQTFVFAQEIAKIAEIREEIIDKAITAFSKVKFEEQNESFISGFVSGVGNEDFTRRTIDKLLANPEVKFHAIRLNRFLTVKIEDLNKLFPIVEENPNYIVGFQYLKYQDLKDTDINKFFIWLSNLSPAGNWLAIDLVEGLLSEKEDRLAELKDLVITLIGRRGLIQTDTPHQLSFYQLELLASRLIKGGINSELVVQLTEEIRDACTKFVMAGEFHLRSILYQLFDKYWDVAWPIMGSAVLDTTFEGWHGVKSLLMGYKSFEDHSFLDWIDENKPNAPVFALMFIKFEKSHDGGKIGWSQIVMKIIDKYGSDERLLQELSARLHSYSITGSAVPLYKSRQELVSSLVNHPNDTVKAFAKREIEYFERKIDEEKKWAENYSLGELW